MQCDLDTSFLGALTAFEEDVHSARRRQNSSLPISRLPSEVLLEILKEVVQSQSSIQDPTTPLPANTPDTARSYRAAEQVCHHWREIILGCRNIWAQKLSAAHLHPLESNVEWRRELYRRSDPVPCSLYLTDRYGTGPASFLDRMAQIGEKYLPCIDSLTLHILKPTLHSDFNTPFTRLTPILKYLSVYSHHSSFQFDGHLHEECRLETLSLNGVSLNQSMFQSTTYSQLQALSISITPTSSSWMSRTRDWWTFLQFTPLLEDLQFDFYEPLEQHISDPIHLPQLIPLVHLRDLCLMSAPHQIVSEFLLNFSIPSECSMDLEVVLVVQNLPFDAFLAHIRHHIDSWPTSHVCRSIWTFRIEPHSFSVICTPQGYNGGRTWQFQTRFEFEDIEDPGQDVIQQGEFKAIFTAISRILTTALDVEIHLTYLHIELRETLRDMLQSMVSVEALVNPIATSILLRVLAEDVNDVLLPNLTKILFRSQSFISQHFTNPDYAARTIPTDYIHLRSRVGRPIKMAHVDHHCVGAQHAVEVLKAIPNLVVIWDERK